MSDNVQTIPPHGCWQCKEEFDNLPTDVQAKMFAAMTGGHFDALSIIRGDHKDLDLEAARKRGQEWVDDVFEKAHVDHMPETWV